MTWTAITDGELTAGQFVLATTWKKLIDNVEAVNAGDPSVTTLSKRILIDAQTCPPSTPDDYILFGDVSYAEFLPGSLSINQVMPFYSWETPGQISWIVPSSGWYEITVQGGGGGGAPAYLGISNYAYASGGGSIRAHKLLSAGQTLTLRVGAGGAVASVGGSSSVVGADFSLACSGGIGRASDNGSIPFSGSTSFSNVTVIANQPSQMSHMGLDPALYGPYLSSAVVGWGGAISTAGHSGIIVIERVSNNGL